MERTENTHLTSCPQFPSHLKQRARIAVEVAEWDYDCAWVSAGLVVRFVVYAVDNAFLIVVRELLVNGEVKEATEAFGVGISSRDVLLMGLS